MDIKRECGQRVRARRKELGLIQIALATRAGLHRNYLGDVERGKRNISLVNIHKLARALELEPGELVGTPRKDRAIRRALKDLEQAARYLEEMNAIIEKQGGGELPEASERLSKQLKRAYELLRISIRP